MKVKLNLSDIDTISNLKYTLKIKCAVHAWVHVIDISGHFIFLLQTKSHPSDTALMVVMPSGYDEKKSLYVVWWKGRQSPLPQDLLQGTDGWLLRCLCFCSDKRLRSDMASVLFRDRHYTYHWKMPLQHITVIVPLKLSTVTHTSISQKSAACPYLALNRALFL